MTALGFIETEGLVGAIECADAMLKAADVRLLEKTCVGAGLVTITVTGEVSAVKASIDAGAAAIKRINGSKLVSEHVIARPDTELENIISTRVLTPEEAPAETSAVEEPEVEPADQSLETEPGLEEKEETVEIEEAPVEEPVEEAKETESKEIAEEVIAEIVEEAPAEEIQEEEKPEVKEETSKAPAKSESPLYKVSQLKKMNVSRLRLVARSLEGLSLAKKDINSARKKELIEAILNAYRQEEE